jgi:hypothetical protein
VSLEVTPQVAMALDSSGQRVLNSTSRWPLVEAPPLLTHGLPNTMHGNLACMYSYYDLCIMRAG